MMLGLEQRGATPSSIPSVGIQQITRLEGVLMIGDKPIGVNLGGAHNEQVVATETRLNGLLEELKDRADNLYLFTWKGGKIPRGATLGGKEIGWTQHGIVTSVNGEQLGYYDRLVEFGGEDGQEQKMIVYTMGGDTSTTTP